MRKGALLVYSLLITSFVYGQQLDSIPIVARGATLKEISHQFTFTEGPAADKQGNVYFTDQPNNNIWKYDVDGSLSLFLDRAGRSNGMTFDHHGNLLTCADENNELWSISPDKQVTVLLDNFEGKRLNGPNDLWTDATGGIYFTDPYYQRDYWTRKTPEIKEQRVYYLPKGKQQPIVAAADLQQPNGIVGTPDGKYLYVADIAANKTYKYRIQPDGQLTARTLFLEHGNDGMTLDSQGNLYITGKGVTIYNPQGQQLGYIPIASGWVGNVCFGGKARNILFITASKAVYTLEMRVKGVE